MPVRCAHCGAPNAEHRRFCGACGARLGDPDASGLAYALGHLHEWALAAALTAEAEDRLRLILRQALVLARDASAAPTDEAEPPRAPSPTAEVPRDRPRVVGTTAGPDPIQRGIQAIRTFAFEQTPSLLLYIGAFLIVVSSFIFVNVSGDQISDLLKLVLMVVGTGGFLGAGIVCHRYPRVLPAGRTFLVIGALITPLDFAAYYVLVAHTSPLDTPMLWIVGSLVSAALYAGLRVGGYGIGYSYLFFAAILSAIFGLEALVRFPLAWVPVPFAALALALELAGKLAGSLVTTLLGPLPRMTMIVAALTGLALVLPLSSPVVTQRFALPIEIALLSGYYLLRAPGGMRWEQVLATVGPGMALVALVIASEAGVSRVGLASVLVGMLYIGHDFAPKVGRMLRARASWAAGGLTSLGVLFLAAGALPVSAYASDAAVGAAAYVAAGATVGALSLVWDDRPGWFESVRGEWLLVPAAIGLAVGYRFALDAVGLLPLRVSAAADLARVYAPLTLAAWGAAAALRRSPPHLVVAVGVAAAASVAVSVGSYDDAPLHALVNLVYAAGAATAGLRFASAASVRVRLAGAAIAEANLALWVAGVAAMAAALGTARWSGTGPTWLPIFALAPAVVAYALSVIGAVRRSRATLVQIAIAAASFAAGLGLESSLASRVPWDSEVWRTAMVAVAVAGILSALEAWRLRSLEGALAAAVALPVLANMGVATLHPTVPEPLTAPLAVYAYAAVWVARRSRVFDLARNAMGVEYVAAALAIVPTALRATDVGTFLATGAIGLAMMLAASRRDLVATAHVALAGFAVLALQRLAVDPGLDELRILFGALLLGLSVANLRRPDLVRTPVLEAVELVGAALILIPTGAVVAVVPNARDYDLPMALLLCVEIAGILALGVVLRRLMLVRTGLAAGVASGGLFVALASFGEWYAAAVGSAMINAALGISRRWPREMAKREGAALGGLGVVVLFLPTLGDTIVAATLARNAGVLAGAIGVAVAAGALGERWITGAALGVVAVEAAVATATPGLLQPASIVAGAVLIALAIAFPRFRRGGLPREFATALDALGAWLFLLPTFLLTFGRDGAVQNAVLMAETVVLLFAALGFRRRWQVAVSLGVVAIQALRAIVDVVNRLPNWATFAIAGALLLAIGFLLLLKREFFARWRARLVRWWLAWLAASP